MDAIITNTTTTNILPTTPNTLTRTTVFRLLTRKPSNPRAVLKSKITPTYNYDLIDKYIAEIPQDAIDEYSKYWETIKPITDEEYFKRWLFAFLSVHTAWSSNVRGYINVTKDPLQSKLQLRDIISYSGVGLIEMRTNGMWQFKEDFFKDPKVWKKQEGETWVQFRDRTMNMSFGIGYAKTAFAIELCYPTECEVTCLDIHMLRFYNDKTKGHQSPEEYKKLEQHWITACKNRKIPAFMARNIYWDGIQHQANSKYWSWIFETPLTK